MVEPYAVHRGGVGPSARYVPRRRNRDVRESLLRERRSAPTVRMLARICSVQPKDVPILVLAYEHRDREPTILTNDRSFSEFEPAAHSLPELAIEYVP